MREILPQFVRYVAVGVMNTILYFIVVNVLSISLDVYAGAPIIFMNAVATLLVVIHSYLWNKRWVFGVAGPHRARVFMKFIFVNCVAFVLNTTIVYTLTTYLPPAFGVSPLLWENIAQALGVAVVIVWNFYGFRRLVFAPNSPSTPLITNAEREEMR